MSIDDLCAAYGAVPLPPLPGKNVGLSRSAQDTVQPLNGARTNPVGRSCGWYIWGGEYSDADDFFRPVYVEHISEICPRALPFLDLPPGWRFHVNGDFVDVWFDEHMDVSNGADELACSTCGRYHDDTPSVWGFESPAAYAGLSWFGRRKALLNEDICAFHADSKTHCFVRALVHLPLICGGEFSWLVWVSIAPAEFDRLVNDWESPRRSEWAPVPGTLGDMLPYSEPTLGLSVELKHRPVGQRPTVKVMDVSHPLYYEQRDGISRDRAEQLGRLVQRRP